jgi:hypothetical protein
MVHGGFRADAFGVRRHKNAREPPAADGVRSHDIDADASRPNSSASDLLRPVVSSIPRSRIERAVSECRASRREVAERIAPRSEQDGVDEARLAAGAVHAPPELPESWRSDEQPRAREAEQPCHPPRGPLGEAIGYALGQWYALTLFHGPAPADRQQRFRARASRCVPHSAAAQDGVSRHAFGARGSCM